MAPIRERLPTEMIPPSQNAPSPGGDVLPPPVRKSWGMVWLTLVAVGGVIAFYLWTASSPNVPFTFHGQQQDYYNLLTDSFLAGHLYLPVKPSPELLSPDPAVRAHAPFLLDASLYHGRYYLYFGVTPVLVAFLPWTVVFGNDLPVNFAAVLFASLGFILSVILLWRIRQRHATAATPGIWLSLVVALGFCTMVPTALRTANFYEVAICSAYAFTMLFFLGFHEALTARRRTGLWLAMASLGYGLAVGSRPNLVFGGLILPGTVILCWWPARNQAGAWRSLGRLLLAAGLPAAACLSGLLIYNYLRFGDCLEFGLRYHLGLHAVRSQFSVPYLWHNLRLYYFTLPEFSRYFPFFYPGRESPPPPGYIVFDFTHGQFFLLPLVLLALTGGVICARRHSVARLPLPLGVALGFWFLSSSLVVGSLCGRTNRYMIDFQPALLLLVGLALLLTDASAWPWRRWFTIGCGALLLFGSFYNAMISMQAHESFQKNNRPAYERLARVFDYPSWWYQRLTHETIGPLSLEVVFPKAAPGTLEPFIATGTPWFSDFLFIHYESPGTIRFVLEHAGYGGPSSPPVAIVPGRVYRMEVELGSLYPPEDHPFFSGRPRAQMRLLKRTARVTLDGVEVFRASASFYDASPSQLYVGENRLQPAMTTGRFSGRVIAKAIQPLDLRQLSPAAKTETGPVVLRVELPRDRPGAVEPLVVSGTLGKADVLFVQYVDSDHIRFGLDHWGHPAIYSPMVSVDYAVPHEIEIHLGSLLPPTADAGARHLLAIALDHKDVFATHTEFYAVAAGTLDLGCNSVGASTCRDYFSGDILSYGRPGPPPARLMAMDVARPSLLTLRFPVGREGRTEPIFSTVDAMGRPIVCFVHYAKPDSVQLGVLLGTERSEGPVMPVDFSRNHELLIGIVPATTAAAEPATALGHYFEHQWAGSLHLYLDGRLALARADVKWSLEPSPWYWAGNLQGASNACAASYTGGMDRPGTEDPLQAVFGSLTAPGGPLQLTVALPRGCTGRTEPLVITGITAGGDALYVEYSDEHHVRFGFDHWGEGGPLSAPVELDYGRPHLLTLWMESLPHPPQEKPAPSIGDLWVEVDGRRVWTLTARFHPAVPTPLHIGANPIGISTCGRHFTGEIQAAERLSSQPQGG